MKIYLLQTDAQCEIQIICLEFVCLYADADEKRRQGWRIIPYSGPFV
jgi:hypothetical protein